MRRFLQILGLLLLLAVIYAILVGLGVTSSLKRHKTALKAQVICDFEAPNDDFDWTTGGYVKVEPAPENATHGKKSAKCTFLLSSQFFPTPTPGAVWQPQMAMDTGSVSRLQVFDWHEYLAFKMDAFNPQDQSVTYFLRITDSHAFTHESTGTMIPKKVTNVSVDLADLAKDRLDLNNIQSIRFWVDTTTAIQPVVVYLDNIRLEGDAAPQQKKK
jgi:hypothetical protein